MVATTCIFLSTKVEETPHKLEYVIQVCYYVQHKREIVVNSAEYKALEEKVLRMERLLLQTLGFDLKVKHPYRYLLTYLKQLNFNDRILAQTAWNFVNDSLRTTLCLQFPPEKIAAAVIYLAARYMEIMDRLPEDWLVRLNADQETIENISEQIMDLYAGSDHVTKIKQVSNSNSSSQQQQQQSPAAANQHQQQRTTSDESKQALKQEQ